MISPLLKRWSKKKCLVSDFNLFRRKNMFQCHAMESKLKTLNLKITSDSLSSKAFLKKRIYLSWGLGCTLIYSWKSKVECYWVLKQVVACWTVDNRDPLFAFPSTQFECWKTFAICLLRRYWLNKGRLQVWLKWATFINRFDRKHVRLSDIRSLSQSANVRLSKWL
jgi:hypothetical protein